MDMRFDGKVAVITGAGRGLGRSEALLLAGRGARVVVNDLGVERDGHGRSTAPAQMVVDKIVSAGGIAIANGADVATEAGVRALISDAVQAFGGVDILVCNAGIITHNIEPPNIQWAELQRLLDLMVSGYAMTISAAWPHLMASQAGRVVLTSSTGMLGLRGAAPYGAAKGGVFGLTRCLAVDGEPHGIKVNAICPLGMTRLFEGFSDDAGFNARFSKNAKPEYVAPTVGYLSHEECEPTGRLFLTGVGSVSELFVGSTPGWRQVDHEIEDVRANFAAITNTEGFVTPATGLAAGAALLRDMPALPGR